MRRVLMTSCYAGHVPTLNLIATSTPVTYGGFEVGEKTARTAYSFANLGMEPDSENCRPGRYEGEFLFLCTLPIAEPRQDRQVTETFLLLVEERASMLDAIYNRVLTRGLGAVLVPSVGESPLGSTGPWVRSDAYHMQLGDSFLLEPCTRSEWQASAKQRNQLIKK